MHSAFIHPFFVLLSDTFPPIRLLHIYPSILLAINPVLIHLSGIHPFIPHLSIHPVSTCPCISLPDHLPSAPYSTIDTRYFMNLTTISFQLASHCVDSSSQRRMNRPMNTHLSFTTTFNTNTIVRPVWMGTLKTWFDLTVSTSDLRLGELTHA